MEVIENNDFEKEIHDENIDIDILIINTRNNFSKFMADLITPEIEAAINHLMYKYTTANMVMLKYGGRAWNNIVYTEFSRQAETFSGLENVCFLKGNYDLVLFANTKIDLKWFSENLVVDLGQIEQLMLKRFRAMADMDINHTYNYNNYGLTGYFSLKSGTGFPAAPTDMPTCNTVSCGYRWHLELKRIENKDTTFPLIIPGEVSRSLLYFECSAFPVLLFNDFKHIMVNKTDPYFLSSFGLFFITSLLLTDRKDEKGVSIDTIRKKFMENHILPKIMTTESLSALFPYFSGSFNILTNKPDFINYVFIIIFSKLFIHDRINISNTFYKNIQSQIMLAAFNNYNAIVKDSVTNYSEWLKEFNDNILDVSNAPTDFPSFRLIINWILVLIEKNFDKKTRIEKSGGDALRYYLPEILKHTSDIDSKIFYTNKKDLTSLQDKIIVVLVCLIKYMEQNRYFRYNNYVIITFGQFEYTVTFNSTGQENVLSCRFLREFVIPLMSIDLKINYSISTAVDGVEYKFSSSYRNPILDIGFNITTIETITEKKLPENANTVTTGENRDTLTGVYVSESDLYVTSPLPTVAYLKKDIESMLTPGINATLRKEAGKTDKDSQRLSALNSLTEETIKTNINAGLDNLEQLKQATPASIAEKNRVLIFFDTILKYSFDLQNLLHPEENPLYLAIKGFFNNEDSIAVDILYISYYLGFNEKINKHLYFSQYKRTQQKDYIYGVLTEKYNALLEKDIQTKLRKSSLRSSPYSRPKTYRGIKNGKIGGRKFNTKKNMNKWKKHTKKLIKKKGKHTKKLIKKKGKKQKN